jgi:hypothetical protein
MNRNARFYFANLGADVARCVSADAAGDSERYGTSVSRAYQTLNHLRDGGYVTAFEEGLLLLRGLEEARSAKSLPSFRVRLNALIGEYATL